MKNKNRTFDHTVNTKITLVAGRKKNLFLVVV